MTWKGYFSWHSRVIGVLTIIVAMTGWVTSKNPMVEVAVAGFVTFGVVMLVVSP